MARHDTDMTTGSVWKHLILFALPLLLGNVFQQLYNTVDSIVVGNCVGKEALAAVGTTGSIINTIIGFFMGLSTGASVVISQYYGAKDEENVHKAVHTTIALTLIMCVVFTIVGVAMVPAMLRLMDTPADVWDLSKEYLTIYFAGVTGLMLYNMGSGILRAVGDSKRPLYFLIFSALTNTALDLVFVVYFRLGVAGVAYATVISQLLSSLLVLYTLMRSDASYRLVLRDIGLDRRILRRVFHIGLPTAIQQSITSFSNVIVQSYINSFGSACMAGWSSYSKLDQFCLLPMQSLALSNTTFAGQNLGAGKVKRVREGARKTLVLTLSTTAVVLVPLLTFAPVCIELFNNDAEVIAYGTMFLRWLGPFYLMNCINQTFAGTMRGTGDTRVPTLIMMTSFIVCRQIYLYVIAHTYNTILCIAMGYPLGWCICSISMYLYYRTGAWERKARREMKLGQETGK